MRVSATVHGHTTVRRLRGRAIGRRFATVRRAALTSLGGHHYQVDLTPNVGHAPKQAWLSGAASVLERGHKLEQAKPIQLNGSALKAGEVHLALPKTLPAGRYTLKLSLLEATVNGPIRLFSFISLNWRGKPLTSYQVVIELIAATTTNTGLKVFARLDDTAYPQTIKITDEQIAAVNITGHQFHPEWNYGISPSVVNS